MTNRLALERSPYLRQHADNPVDWYPWGEAAFDKARHERKPIFLSVGYSTCHWCHVMERESFADEQSARLMNAHFVNVKVDREERPDVDRVYMTFVQATTGSGGWPMSVFLTPDLKPFHGGTYYPPVDRFRMPGFPRLLRTVADAWQADSTNIEQQAAVILDRLSGDPGAGAYVANEPNPGWLVDALNHARQQYDAAYGGFGDAPRFPRPPGLELLAAASTLEGGDGDDARDMLLHTLKAMADGGMHDHLGGGFHRYSVDRYWHVPHYEKMLYDQAQLVECYLDGYLLSGEPALAGVACDTLDYVIRDLSSPGGGFCAAEDADSMRRGERHGAEGAFYVWTIEEVRSELGEDADLFCQAYGVEKEGNSPPGSDPHGELAGFNTLLRRLDDNGVAERVGIDATEVADRLQRSRRRLFEARAKRPRPARDDKVVTAWNGLVIGALARAARVLERPQYRLQAEQAAAFIHRQCWNEDRRTLARSWLGEASAADGVASDYALLVQGLLDLFEAGADASWLKWALELQQRMNELFGDETSGAWFDTTDSDKSILLRLREDYDGAEPAATSIAVRNCLRLAAMTGDDSLRQRAMRAAAAAGDRPWVSASLTASLPALLSYPATVVVAGDPTAAGALRRVVDRSFAPFTSLVCLDGPRESAWLRELAPHLAAMRAIEGRATAYFCEGATCRAPVTDPSALQRMLSHR